LIVALLKRKAENPVAALERELSDLTARRAALEVKLTDAAGALAVAVDESLFVFVGFSDNRGLAVFVLLVVIFRLVVIIVIVWLIWVSRRHRIADEVQPSEKVFGDALDHVGLYNPSDPLTRADLRRFKSTSGSNREAESTDAPERGGLPRSSCQIVRSRLLIGAWWQVKRVRLSLVPGAAIETAGGLRALRHRWA
jgi:hypothetical protein